MAGLRCGPTLQLTCRLRRNLWHSALFRACSSLDLVSQNIAQILEKPSWSVRSLLPDGTKSSTLLIDSKKLQHLLRLSALPQPASQVEEMATLKILESQVYFVKEIQRVDTIGIRPLQSIHDESEEALQECTIGLDDLKEAMAKEQVIGRRQRIQRLRAEKSGLPDGTAWDGNALGYTSNAIGKFFVVKSGYNNRA